MVVIKGSKESIMKEQEMTDNRSGHRLSAVLFLTGLILIALYTDFVFVRYKLSGEPDLSYWTQDSEADTEAEYTACMPGKLVFLSANGGISKLCGIREVNGIVRMKNGQLTAVNSKIDETQLRAEADKVGQLYEWLKANDTAFLYVAVPVKEDKDHSELPTGFADHVNDNMDVFLEELDRWDVPYMDMRQVLKESGSDIYSCFYNTDHHWTTQTGFYAYTRITEQIEKELGIELEDSLTDPKNFRFTTYDKVFLGSRGKRVGVLYGGMDDFTMILPLFTTSFYDADSGETGTFEDFMVNEKYVKEDPDFLASDIYDYALKSRPHIINMLSKNGPDVVLVSDSMGFAVQPYLALASSKLDFVSAYEAGMVSTVVKNTHPDIVVMIHSAEFILPLEESFDFGPEQ